MQKRSKIIYKNIVHKIESVYNIRNKWRTFYLNSGEIKMFFYINCWYLVNFHYFIINIFLQKLILRV